ncbi:ankyrin repeat domain-containing protein [Aspergillus aculeatinus CBS 121060]|uniref:Ankyrin n=1 Tax=Aspergillus aculeatinus CBS 121060 TaxID=1448322 RepID=A0ACD1GZB0_9EURO|nr:ankyrin [Aspergillus aculeatinus CBS 121060]RAH66634.1 ankyrin [Aspergillus aculeatinus CBS 121060]
MVRFLLQTPGIPSSDRRRMLNTQNHEKKATPLRESIYFGDKECTRELLADPDLDMTVADLEGDTPMPASVAIGDFPTLLQIFQMPMYSITDPLESSPRLATPRELKRVERALLDGFSRLEPWESNLFIVMHWAVVNGSLPLAKKCLDTLPILVDYSGPMQAKWLHIASRFDHGELARNLTTYGVDVYATTERGMTALHLACVGGHSVTVRYLLEHLTSQAGNQAPGPGAATPRECDTARLINFIMADDKLGESAISLSAKAKGRGTSDILWAEIETFASNRENLKSFSRADLERL